MIRSSRRPVSLTVIMVLPRPQRFASRSISSSSAAPGGTEGKPMKARRPISNTNKKLKPRAWPKSYCGSHRYNQNWGGVKQRDSSPIFFARWSGWSATLTNAKAGVTDKQHDKKLKLRAGPKSYSCTEEPYSLGKRSRLDASPFFPARSLGRQVVPYLFSQAVQQVGV
jgi:hypothetical protein